MGELSALLLYLITHARMSLFGHFNRFCLDWLNVGEFKDIELFVACFVKLESTKKVFCNKLI